MTHHDERIERRPEEGVPKAPLTELPPPATWADRRGASTTKRPPRKPFLPPRWVPLIAWRVHRGLYRISGGRLGLRPPRPDRFGLLRLTVTGRRTGREREVMLGYVEDGPDLVTLAMNGWAPGEPAWWLNLQAKPDGVVDLVDGTRNVVARRASGEEQQRLWTRWQELDEKLDAYASLRPSETAVVILEPTS